MKKIKEILLIPLVVSLAAPTVSSCIVGNQAHINYEKEQLKISTAAYGTDIDLSDDYLREALDEMNLQKNLGNIIDNKAETILDKFVRLNPQLEKDQLEISEISFKNAFIGAKRRGKYRGKVFVNFAIKDPSLKKYIVNRELGFIQNCSEKIIKDRLFKLNTDLVPKELSIINMTTTGATVKVNPDSSIYNPGDTVDITYETPKFSIKDHLKADLPLSVIDHTIDSIKSSLKKLRPDLDLNEVVIPKDFITDTSFKIKASETSKKYRDEGLITVKLKIVVRYNLSSFEGPRGLGYLFPKDVLFNGVIDMYTDEELV